MMRFFMTLRSNLVAVIASALVFVVYSSPQQRIATTEPIVSGGCKTDVPQPDCGLHVWPMKCPQLLEAYEWDLKEAPITTHDKTCCSFSDTDDGGCLLTVGGPGHGCSWKELDHDSYYSVLISDASTSTCPESAYEIPEPRKKTNLPTAAPTPMKVNNPLPQYIYTSTETSRSGACWATEPTPECGIFQWPSSCSDMVKAFQWSGSCCSFSDTEDGGSCVLTVDGPGSQCTWREDGSNYTIYIAESNQNSCPPTDYTVDPTTTQDGWTGPTPESRIESRSCWTVEPSKECGLYSWDTPCSELAALYDWEGSCCSLSDTRDGCLLTVDGPGSDCTWGTGGHDNTITIDKSNQGSCPESVYKVSNEATIETTGRTPKPIHSGECRTSTPDETCGIYTWPESCDEVMSLFEWSGTCCSLSTTDDGGCKLTVDGPGSVCTWKELQRESYYNVFIDETNSNTCPESDFNCLRKINPFVTCVTDKFTQCLSTCESYPLLRPSFKACYKEDKTQALLCAAGAVSVCSELKGKAPRYLCNKMDAMYTSGALQIDECLDLKEKCSHVVSDNACS